MGGGNRGKHGHLRGKTKGIMLQKCEKGEMLKERGGGKREIMIWRKDKNTKAKNSREK